MSDLLALHGSEMSWKNNSQRKYCTLTNSNFAKEIITDKHYRKNLCIFQVSSILLPETEKLPLVFYDYIAQSSGGSSHVVPTIERNSMKLYVDLMHAFSSLLTTDTEKPAQLPVNVHENLIPMTGMFIMQLTSLIFSFWTKY